MDTMVEGTIGDQENWWQRDNYRNDQNGIYVHPRNKDKGRTGSSNSRLEEMVTQVLEKVESTKTGVKELKSDVLKMNHLVESHSTSIKHLEQQMGQLSIAVNQRKNGTLPSDTVPNPQTEK